MKGSSDDVSKLTLSWYEGLAFCLAFELEAEQRMDEVGESAMRASVWSQSFFPHVSAVMRTLSQNSR
jgi:hypothetical protein